MADSPDYRGSRSQNLLQRRQQTLVLIASADGDADPARDRLTIVMADQDLALVQGGDDLGGGLRRDRKSTRLNSSHVEISYAVFCLKKKKKKKKKSKIQYKEKEK